jgi:predicted nucleotidyltransferase
MWRKFRGSRGGADIDGRKYGFAGTRLREMTEEEILTKAVEIIRRRLPEDFHCKVFLFGSRATGTAGDRSDFDIGIEGNGPVPSGTMTEIRWDLDGMPILHTVEVVDFAVVTEAFARVAKEKTRVLYER